MFPSPSPSQTQTQHQTQTQPQSRPRPQPRPHPIPPTIWSHSETVTLIETYQQKWYSLNRRPLNSAQWEEIAFTVATRLGLPRPSKSPTQCRHKIDKLRKRYRSESLKIPPSPLSWAYFPLLHRLEHGDAEIGRDVCEGGGGGRRGGGLGGEMRGFVEMFVDVEKMWLDFLRENERFKSDMEDKRLKMILVQNHKTACFVSKLFGVDNAC